MEDENLIIITFNSIIIMIHLQNPIQNGANDMSEKLNMLTVFVKKLRTSCCWDDFNLIKILPVSGR